MTVSELIELLYAVSGEETVYARTPQKHKMKVTGAAVVDNKLYLSTDWENPTTPYERKRQYMLAKARAARAVEEGRTPGQRGRPKGSKDKKKRKKRGSKTHLYYRLKNQEEK